MYLSLTLMDKTGRIGAKWWDCPEDDCAAVQGYVYATICGTLKADAHYPLEVHMNQCPQAMDAPEDLSDYETCAALPLGELQTRLLVHVGRVTVRPLQALLGRIFEDPPFRARFDHAPAAQSYHHAHRHGLLQHTVEVADLASALVERQKTWGYRALSRDLTLTGALLHDIGKVDELTWQDGVYGNSRRGALLGHTLIGVQRVSKAMGNIPDFPDDLRDAVLHMVASHHGHQEFGAPVVPAFPEAQIVHTADLLDAQLFYMHEAVAEASADFVRVPKMEKRQIYALAFSGLDDGALLAAGTAPGTAAETRSADEAPALLPRTATLPMLRFHISGENTTFHTRSLALVGQVAAGQPIPADEHIEGYFDVEDEKLSPGGECFLLRVKGDSMTPDGITDGGLIVVRRQQDHQPGEIVVARLSDSDEAAVKRITYGGDSSAQLLSSNPAHPPIAVPDASALTICGRVVAVAVGAHAPA